MQEDRGSLMPGRMTWSHSVKPPDVFEPQKEDQIKTKWQMALTGVLAAVLYIYLSDVIFSGLIFWIVSSAIVLAYAVFVMIIWWKKGKNVRNTVAFIFSSLLVGALFVKYVFPLF